MLVICVCQRLDWSECVKASGHRGLLLLPFVQSAGTVEQLLAWYTCICAVFSSDYLTRYDS